jgi:paraquat-inducible protein B
MSEQHPGPDDLAEAVIDTHRRPSIVWLIPLIAALVGGFVAWRTFSERGPEIAIELANAEGLEAGKTKVRYKNVEIGLVEEVTLDEDLRSVTARARMVHGADRYLREGTRFWVVKARVAGGQVTGLGTLFSGAYIGMDPVLDGPSTRHFRALEVPPVVTSEEPGRHFVLRSYRAGVTDVGSPVYFRRVQVGEVVESALDPSGDFATVRVFVHAPWDAHVNQDTRFWNASGLDISMSASGVQFNTQSIVSMLIGGIAFDTPVDAEGGPAGEEAVFPLYENFEATRQEIYTVRTHYLLYFDQSVRGLVPGSPVEFRGIRIGQVRDVKLETAPDGKGFRIPVVIEVEPERVGHLPAPDKRRAAMDALVAAGLRAQLARGNLLTGQLLVSLDMHPGAPPAHIVWQEPYPEFPTIPTPLEEVTESLTQLVKRLEKIPFDQIGADLRASLGAAQAALSQAEKTMASTQALVGPDSAVNQELRRALVELTEASRSLGLAADQIEREPNSLLFGKGKE